MPLYSVEEGGVDEREKIQFLISLYVVSNKFANSCVALRRTKLKQIRITSKKPHVGRLTVFKYINDLI